MYRDKIHSYIIEHKEEMIEDAKKLIQINSTRMEPEEGMPFGRGPAKVLDTASEMLSSYGFSVSNYNNYVITADFNEKEPNLDILAHLDVVPAGNDWTITDPFEPVVQDGKLYGRGSADDKGPAVAVIYAMRAIQELNIPLKTGVRLILGADEECGSSDISYFYKKSQPSLMTISPDAAFPVINIEKGILIGKFNGSYEPEKKLPYILSVDAGNKFNVIPDRAHAKLVGLSETIITTYASMIEEETQIHFNITKENDLITIEAEGISAHGSEPYKGNNALTGLLYLLSTLPLADTRANNFVRLCSQLFPHGDYFGKALGINLEDSESGKTTISFDMFHMDEMSLSGCFDCRTSIIANEENTTRVLENAIAKTGLMPEKMSIYPPHYVPSDSKLVQVLLNSYRKFTGREETPIATGGGTYVHGIPNGVAFGCAINEIDNHMHGPDEFVHIDQMLLSAEIYADAIISLCENK